MLSRLANYKRTMVIVAAIVVRIVVLVAFPAIFDFGANGDALHGSVAYDEYALNLLDTGVYGRTAGVPDAVLPPLYSYVLAAVYSLFGRSYVAVGVLHILFDVCSIALLYDIARRLFSQPRQHGDWIGALAGLFFALYPYLIFQNLTMADTALWITLLHLFVWLMILLRDRERYDRGTVALGVAGGIVLGLSALARALLPPLAILVTLWFLFRLSWRQTLLRLLPAAIVSMVVLLPWLSRSSQIYGGFVAVSLNSGENLYQGNNRQTIPIFRAGYDVQWSSRPPDAPDNDDPYLNNQALMNAGLRYLRENPARIPELLLVKFGIYWNVQVTPINNLRQGERLRVTDAGELRIVTDEGSQTGVTAANAAYQDDSLFTVIGRNLHVLYFGGLWLLAIAGLWLSRRGWRDMSLLVLAQLSQTAVYLLFHPSTRYRSPTDPLLFVFSAVAVVWLVMRWRSNPHPPVPRSTGAEFPYTR